MTDSTETPAASKKPNFDNPLGDPVIRQLDTQELSEGFRAIWRTKENKPVIFRLIFFTALMFSVPFITFYLFHDALLEGWDRDSRLTWSGIASVVSVNIIIFFYIVLAVLEDDRKPNAPPAPKSKKPKDN